MRSYFLKIFLLIIAAFAFIKVNAQGNNTPLTCNGSLGDPVFTEDFGSGTKDQKPLGSDITNLSYYTNPDPGPSCGNIPDGDYIISNIAPKCYAGWLDVETDHTFSTNGDPDGNMMIINATQNPDGAPPSVFFTQPITNQLCPNTKYEFSAWVLNLDRDGPGVIRPNIIFSIITADGTTTSVSTGDIVPQGVEWQQFKLIFQTSANQGDITLKMTNNANGGNGNDLALDDITFRPCGPLIEAGIDQITSNAPQNLCLGTAKDFNLVGQPVLDKPGDGYTDPFYQWQQNKNNSEWMDIKGATSENYVAPFDATTKVGTYQFRLGSGELVNLGSSQCRVYSEPISITVNAYPATPTIAVTPACEGEQLTLTANSSGAVNYTWTTGPGITAANRNDNPLIIANATAADNGDYSVEASSAGQCTTVSLPVTINVPPKPVITITGTQTICQGKTDTLHASSPGNNHYAWTPTAGLIDPTLPDQVVNPADTTTYTVTVTNDGGCSETASVIVNVIPPPIVTLPSKINILEGQSVLLNATAQNADIFSWTPTTNLTGDKTLTPTATPTADITYTLTASSQYNCGTVQKSIFVRVFKKVTVLNTFSPNGDGVNDNWEIVGLATYPTCTLKVFNRYGQQVFDSIGYDKPWKGTYKGRALPAGTYYYSIDLKNDLPLLSGWVLIVY